MKHRITASSSTRRHRRTLLGPAAAISHASLGFIFWSVFALRFWRPLLVGLFAGIGGQSTRYRLGFLAGVLMTGVGYALANRP